MEINIVKDLMHSPHPHHPPKKKKKTQPLVIAMFGIRRLTSKYLTQPPCSIK